MNELKQYEGGVFSAHAEMFLILVNLVDMASGILRACGDVSYVRSP